MSFYDVLQAVPATPDAPVPVPQPVLPPVYGGGGGGFGQDEHDVFDNDGDYL